MNTIVADDFLYAQHVIPQEHLVGTTWIGKDFSSLQGSLMKYDANKSFKTHKHILNPRIINKTQECFIVAQGLLKVTIYIKEKPKTTNCVPIPLKDKDGNNYYELGQFMAKSGEAIFVWGGFHKIDILDDKTIAYEIKAGQFNGVVSDDKELLND